VLDVWLARSYRLLLVRKLMSLDFEVAEFVVEISTLKSPSTIG